MKLYAIQGMLRHGLNVCAANARVFVRSTVDVDAMLSGEGAAGEGGSLNGVGGLIDSYGKAGFSLGRKAGVYIAAVVLLIFFIGMMIHGSNVQKRGEKKEGAPWILFGIIGIFAVAGVLTFLQTVGGSLFTTSDE